MLDGCPVCFVTSVGFSARVLCFEGDAAPQSGTVIISGRLGRWGLKSSGEGFQDLDIEPYRSAWSAGLEGPI